MKNFERAVFIFAIILAVYYFASLLEVISQNCWYNPHYHDWNLFVILLSHARTY